jgi:hypothetical protein
MDYGREFLELAHAAMKAEEAELKRLGCARYSDVSSVSQFEEAWHGHVILRQAIRMQKYPRLSFEFPCGNKKRADFCFMDEDDHALAAFELKPGRANAHLAECLVSDCEKMYDFTALAPEVPRYALGIICGSPYELDEWEEMLEAQLRKSGNETCRIAAPPDIPSNLPGKVIRFVMFRVPAAISLGSKSM